MRKITIALVAICLASFASQASYASEDFATETVEHTDAQIKSIEGFSHFQADELGNTTVVFSQSPGEDLKNNLKQVEYSLLVDEAALSQRQVDSYSAFFSSEFANRKLEVFFGPSSDFHSFNVNCVPVSCDQVREIIRASGLADVVIDEQPNLGLEAQGNIIGGLDLDGECTGAFMGYINGELGVLTAKHCIQTWEYFAYGSEWVLGSLVSPDPDIDVAFVFVSGTSNGYVRTAGGIYEPMVRGRSPILYELVCHFGITSGKSCSKVIALGQSFTDSKGHTYKSLAVTEQSISSPGDSGGPWYTNTANKTAVGSHTGVVMFKGLMRSVFTTLGAANILKIDFI